MLQAKRVSQVTFLQSEAFDRIPAVVHGFSTRRAERNDFSLGPASSPDPLVQMNRVRFAAAVGASGWPIMKLKQVHSAIVRDIDDTSAADEPLEGDAAVTALPGVLLGVQTADCAPILIACTEARGAAAIHAGWRGTAAHVTEAAVTRIIAKLQLDPKDLAAVIGPHIGVCCYEVGPEVRDAIGDPSVFEGRRLNLAEANRRQLTSCGVSPDRIEVSSLCTRCRPDLFYSYRQEGDKTGRMLSVIGIAP
jgi:YfiH family protein